ncbi:hypothetical protein [Paraburkholderia bryophila]|uniref:Uncharacterized protein n=1 Tax=Paraburkholderia bryophila TaxID=420952 RepID=A0A7Y9WIN5_9BURK|nr:hypothetical protein [Paraburkholderia bryophila]NYH19945.1 hypothetical protein [Paraburkholderia bryophila]NYH21015.1 hypothetical protein [Paraburkholderia bryophila]
MTTESTSLPDLYRANLGLALHAMDRRQQACQRAGEFERLNAAASPAASRGVARKGEQHVA